MLSVNSTRELARFYKVLDGSVKLAQMINITCFFMGLSYIWESEFKFVNKKFIPFKKKRGGNQIFTNMFPGAII